jgi:hypothetical protein
LWYEARIKAEKYQLDNAHAKITQDQDDIAQKYPDIYEEFEIDLVWLRLIYNFWAERKNRQVYEEKFFALENEYHPISVALLFLRYGIELVKHREVPRAQEIFALALRFALNIKGDSDGETDEPDVVSAKTVLPMIEYLGNLLFEPRHPKPLVTFCQRIDALAAERSRVLPRIPERDHALNWRKVLDAVPKAKKESLRAAARKLLNLGGKKPIRQTTYDVTKRTTLDYDIFMLLGDSYLPDHPPEALDVFGKAAQAFPLEIHPLLRIADVAASINDIKTAAAAYRAVCSKVPYHFGAKLGLLRLMDRGAAIDPVVLDPIETEFAEIYGCLGGNLNLLFRESRERMAELGDQMPEEPTVIAFSRVDLMQELGSHLQGAAGKMSPEEFETQFLAQFQSTNQAVSVEPAGAGSIAAEYRFADDEPEPIAVDEINPSILELEDDETFTEEAGVWSPEPALVVEANVLETRKQLLTSERDLAPEALEVENPDHLLPAPGPAIETPNPFMKPSAPKIPVSPAGAASQLTNLLQAGAQKAATPFVRESATQTKSLLEALPPAQIEEEGRRRKKAKGSEPEDRPTIVGQKTIRPVKKKTVTGLEGFEEEMESHRPR